MSVFADTGPQAAMLSGGRKLHLQHGPIDLIVVAEGRSDEVRKAYLQAKDAFEGLLATLVEELPALRQPVSDGPAHFAGPVAQRMAAATAVHTTCFITPMAAVAGAVADHVLGALKEGRNLRRAHVNNGGDIALYLNKNEMFRIGVCTDPHTGRQGSTVTVTADDGIGGIATSGWRGRSHSLGIADAVTVLAANAANADAAATLIANAVDLPGSPLITRRPAVELAPDSDLGSRLVTVGIETLAQRDVDHALSAGEAVAKRMVEQGLITSAFLTLQDVVRVAGEPPAARNRNHTRPPTVTSELLHA